MNNPWDADFYPQWMWDLGANIIYPAAIIAGVLYLWQKGPKLLINYGPRLFTRWGHSWDAKRENGNGDKRTPPTVR